MSVRYSLLAILDSGPRHGYGLKSEFEAATGNVWPLNVGQVYSTLSRLERDGLVLAGQDDEGQKIYSISDEGRRDLQHWYETPVEREVVPRQELAIKLVFAMRAGPERERLGVAAAPPGAELAAARGLPEAAGPQRPADAP